MMARAMSTLLKHDTQAHELVLSLRDKGDKSALYKVNGRCKTTASETYLVIQHEREG